MERCKSFFYPLPHVPILLTPLLIAGDAQRWTITINERVFLLQLNQPLHNQAKWFQSCLHLKFLVCIPQNRHTMMFFVNKPKYCCCYAMPISLLEVHSHKHTCEVCRLRACAKMLLMFTAINSLQAVRGVWSFITMWLPSMVPAAWQYNRFQTWPLYKRPELRVEQNNGGAFFLPHQLALFTQWGNLLHVCRGIFSLILLNCLYMSCI